MAQEHGIKVTWHGHACVEVLTSTGKTILFDPWFGNPRSDKPAAAVDGCDLLLVTHGHGDHVSDAVELARRLGPAWPAIHELSVWAGPQVGDRAEVIGMNKGGAVEVAGLRVLMTRAEHSSGGPVEGSATVYLGEPVGFVVELEDGARLYHAGDTDVFGDMALIRELHHPDIAFLPIGGHYTMDPRAAAKAVELLGVGTVFTIHWGTFDVLAGRPDQLRSELARRGLGDVRVVSPEPGETIEL